MSLVSEFIEKHNGDINRAAADMLQRLMADGPNFKLGYTAGNAYAAVMEQFNAAGHTVNEMLLIDYAFPKPVKPQVYVSVSGGIAEAMVVRPVYSFEDNDNAPVDIVLIDWDTWEDDSPSVDYLETLVDHALELKGSHDESAITQMADLIEQSLADGVYDGDPEDNGGVDSDRPESDAWLATQQLNRLKEAINATHAR